MKRSSELLALVVMVAACSRPQHFDQDPVRCAQCHTPEFRSVRNPPHVDARPTTCGVCHVQSGWHRIQIAHPWYELTGAHLAAAELRDLAGTDKTVKCFWCHKGDPSTWKQTKKDCVSCHAADRETSDFPGHDTFPLTCEECHTTVKWKGAKRPDVAAPPPEAHDAGTKPTDAGATHAAGSTRPHPLPTATSTAHPTQTTTVPPTATRPPPDVLTRPSRR